MVMYCPGSRSKAYSHLAPSARQHIWQGLHVFATAVCCVSKQPTASDQGHHPQCNKSGQKLKAQAPPAMSCMLLAEALLL